MKMYWLAAVMLPLILGGCEAYQAKPLNMDADMPHRIPRITVGAAEIPLLRHEAHPFNPDDGLDITDVAILAVVNNPELKLARDDAGIARAQAFDAGLLPNPQLAAGLDFPSSSTSGSNYTATSLGISYDWTSLLPRNAAVGAAKKKVRKYDLVILWREWQVIGEARRLFAQSYYQNRLAKTLTAYRNLLADRYHHVRQAFKDGNVTLNTSGADLAALAGMDRQIAELNRQRLKTHYELTRLLGVAPDVALPLVGDVMLPHMDKSRIDAMLSELAYRRPDMLALKAGYEAQDLKYREAIIRQFPAISISIARASDTSNVETIGPSIALSLPILNHHEGKVAVEKATRKRLYDEFENRLAGARSAISEILKDQRLLKTQLEAVQASKQSLEDAVNAAEKAYAAGDMDEMIYVTLNSRLLDKTLEQIRLEQAVVGQRIALQTLLGTGACQAFNNEGNS